MTPEERDLGIRTVLAEAGSQGDDGMLGVANVIRNRVESGNYGDGVGGVVTKKYAFEPMLHYGTGQGNDPARYSVADPKYQQAARIFDTTMAGGAPDNTKGATHFIAKGLQGDLGRDIPSWAQGKALTTIGGHSFYAPEGAVKTEGSSVTPPNLNASASSTPQVANAASEAAARFLASHTNAAPPTGTTKLPTGQYAGLQALFDSMNQKQQQDQAANQPLLSRLMFGDKGMPNLMGMIKTPNNGQGWLGGMFGQPDQSGATAPQQPDAAQGGAGSIPPLTAPAPIPVQSMPLPPPTMAPIAPQITPVPAAAPSAAPAAAMPSGLGLSGPNFLAPPPGITVPSPALANTPGNTGVGGAALPAFDPAAAAAPATEAASALPSLASLFAMI
jgi:hypothetical protein